MMEFINQYNSKSPAVKRLMREAYEMRELTEDYSAAPVNDNLFEWHFTIRGASDSDYEGGFYHGRIIFPSEYPMKPPNILLLTPNGRFEINKKICLSISGHHPETWQPSWCVRTALLALITFMPTPGSGTVGSLDYSKEERQMLARKSKNWECNECGKILSLLLSNDENEFRENFLNVKNFLSEEIYSVYDIKNTMSKIKTEVSDIKNNEEKEDLINQSDEKYEDTTTLLESDVITCSYKNENQEILTSLNNFNLFANVFSNFSDSKVTIFIIVVLIACLLYRRIFLLE